MFNIGSLVQKAQQLIEPTLSNISAAAPAASDRRPSKATLFRYQFRLPDSQNPLHEITAELTLHPHHSTRGTAATEPQPSHATQGTQPSHGNQGNHYIGKLHLSEAYLCFSTQGASFLSTASSSSSSSFTGQTHGAGPGGNGFTLPLCAIRRVERLHSQSYMFALAITTWNGIPDAKSKSPAGQKLTIQLAGSRQACERFCDALKKGLREGVKEVDTLRKVVAQSYSEYLLTSDDDENKKASGDDAKRGREHPDTGLGTLFRYPGNARKLRDATKIRLWREYLRGISSPCPPATTLLTCNASQTTDEAQPSFDSPPSTNSSASVCPIGYEAKYGSSHPAPSSCAYRTQVYTRRHWQSSRVASRLQSMRSRKI